MEEFDWKENISNKEEKIQLGKEIAKRVKNGDTIGFGSGSTAYATVIEIAKRVKEENLQIQAVPTSKIIEELCYQMAIPVIELKDAKLDWCFDGADEVNQKQWMIKGMGAALFREKLNIVNCSENYILVDETKMVTTLGQKHPIPIECDAQSIFYVIQKVKELGAKNIEIRQSNQTKEPLITDNGNRIVDAWFDNIDEDLERKLKQIVGVIETGLFIGYPVKIITK